MSRWPGLCGCDDGAAEWVGRSMVTVIAPGGGNAGEEGVKKGVCVYEGVRLNKRVVAEGFVYRFAVHE